MKLENLMLGMIVKNYKELCTILEVKPTTGQAKQNQIAWFEEYFSYIKEGHKFIITEVLDMEVEAMPTRGGDTSTLECPNCKIDREDWKSIGVYKITLGDEIYIGSTTRGFRARYLQHTYDYSESSAKDMLDNGAIFEIVENCNGMSEPEIRQLEKLVMKKYKATGDWTVLNKKNPYSYIKSTKTVTKYKAIRVEADKYEEVIALLGEANVKYKEYDRNKLTSKKK